MSQLVHSADYDKIWSAVYGDMQDWGPVHRHMRRILHGLLESIEYKSVLDVGCGVGHNLPLLSKGDQVKHVAGIDISNQAVEQICSSAKWGKAFYPLDIQQGRLQGAWDLVFSALLLEHVPDDLAALNNMRAMTGRYLLATTMAGDFERYQVWEKQVGHVRNYRPGELEAKLEQNGFAVQKTIYWGYPFFSPMARALQNTYKAKRNLGAAARLMAEVLYRLYFFNSYQQGDLLIVLAEV